MMANISEGPSMVNAARDKRLEEVISCSGRFTAGRRQLYGPSVHSLFARREIETDSGAEAEQKDSCLRPKGSAFQRSLFRL